MLDPDRPHTRPDERGCPDCGDDSYDSGCTADGCNGYGTWQPLADAQPVREHVSALVAAGYTITSIAAASDTDAATL
ncbi:hypothetical protein KBZ21_41195, partial [Streptomyces sp. A73]|nr:hypothetical protein [Streptomyces sp. A73]